MNDFPALGARSRARKVISLALAVALSGCGSLQKVRRETRTPEEISGLHPPQLQKMKNDSPYLKAHMRSGDVYVLREWNIESDIGRVTGTGALLGPARDTVRAGTFDLPSDSVAIYETNTKHISSATSVLAVLMGVTIIGAIACATNPKACFGSCPTFYVESGAGAALRAEGFSSSIAPSLEATDVDALRIARCGGEEARVEMRNEALETHVVRRVDVVAVPRPPGARIFGGPEGAFIECGAPLAPAAARGPEGDCLALIGSEDGRERFSLADSTYLAAKESLDLVFHDVPPDSYGLVIGCRQSLLSTYLLYQAYAYMGREAGHWIAEIERGAIMLGPDPIQSLMGGIEIQVRDGAGAWLSAGEMREYGPLAVDVHIVPLGEHRGGDAQVRLRMTKGNWRIDWTALAPMRGAAHGVRLEPSVVLRDGAPDEEARSALIDDSRTLATFPGDAYTLVYRLPEGAGECELFLESRGYYLEWIRDEWLAEENAAHLAGIFMNPREALVRLAPEYKQVEASMEECFWGSRYAKPR